MITLVKWVASQDGDGMLAGRPHVRVPCENSTAPWGLGINKLPFPVGTEMSSDHLIMSIIIMVIPAIWTSTVLTKNLDTTLARDDTHVPVRLDTHSIDSQCKRRTKEWYTRNYARPRKRGRNPSRPPTASGTLTTSPTHIGITPIPAAWRNENQLPDATAPPQK